MYFYISIFAYQCANCSIVLLIDLSMMVFTCKKQRRTKIALSPFSTEKTFLRGYAL